MPPLRRHRSRSRRPRAVAFAGAGVLVAALALSACADDDTATPDVPGLAGAPSATPSSGTTTRPAAAPVAFAPPLPRSMPSTIKIPRIGVSAQVSQLGLQPDGRIETPPLSRPNLAGWWKDGPTPGEGGPAVILGHVDANGKAAVFSRLKELRAGDRVQVTRADGRTATFAVERVEHVPKASFPGEKIYAEDIDYAALRLVTCGGTFDRGTGHYVDNVIAYTRLAQS